MRNSSKVELLGVHLDALQFEDAVATILDWTRSSDSPPRYVVTPNINHLVLHNKNAEFRYAYSKASLVLADGRYVGILAKILGGGTVPDTINGSDLVPAVLAAAEGGDGVRVFLLGALEGVAEHAATQIEARWPKSRVVGAYSPPFGFEKDPAETASIKELINRSAPDLLILGISPPRQEIWLSRTVAELNVRAAICAGATIDFLAGNKARAPAWMQRSGLEWVYRTLQEPGRLLPRYASDAFAITRLLVPELVRRIAGKSDPGKHRN